MNDSVKQAQAQTKAFLFAVKNKMRIKLDEARTLNIKSADEIETFTAAISAIDIAIEAQK